MDYVAWCAQNVSGTSADSQLASTSFGDEAPQKPRSLTKASNIALANHSNRPDHFAITPAVSPVLISGINKLITRLKRTSPLPST
jgi:hypothetical protein